MVEKKIDIEQQRSLLKIEGLTKNFGGLKAVSNFSLDLKEGELRGLIGPNGAGKTTIFNLISGYYKPSSGKIFFKDQDITNESPNKRVDRGIARTFQKLKMGQYMTVLDEVKTAFFRHMKYNFLDAFFQTGKFETEEKEKEEQSIELLDFLGIAHLADELSENLPFGLQRKASIARSLALQPELLLLDEPASGLDSQETNELVGLICQIKDKYKSTIILIEHDMSVIMSICGKIVAINQGEIIGKGTPSEIQQNEDVIKAYLGEPK